VNHSDYPELLRESRMAYEGYDANPKLFQELLRAGRDGYLLDCYRRNQLYVETNHRITFFAHAIRTVYPKAKFVHLYRHPGDFVRSGIRRNWYAGGYYDVCRPRIRDDATWDPMTPIEKLAWLWNQTNQYIETFLSTLESGESFLRVRCEALFSDVDAAAELCDFVGAGISRREIRSMHKRRINRQWTGRMRRYDEWGEDEKLQLSRFAPLAPRYGYEL
jgi:hypothetical protein